MSVLVYDCGSVENTVTAILDTESGAMIVRGNGDIDNYADESSPWYSEHSDILQVTVDKGITRIGSGTFYGCENLSFVEIANTVTTIGADVFQDCTSLTSIKIPKSITDIGNGTFADSGLTEVKFYGNPPNVGTDIFDGVTADVYTPEGNEEWTETAKGTVAGNGSNLTWKTFDSKPNLIEYDELDYLWSKIKKYVDSNVSVTQVVSSGTKIATITINGVATDIYSSGGLSGTVGSSTTPIYIDNGVPTACGGSLDVDITGNAATATSATTASTCSGNAATATTATNANNVQISKITDNDEHPFLFGTTFTNSTTNQAIHHACPSTTGSQCAFRGRMQLSAAGTQGRATLILGNSLATASANNARGELFLYGCGTGYTRFIPSNDTNTNIEVFTPATGGTLALEKQGSVPIYYVQGPSTDTTAGTWTGTIPNLTAYYDGLTILYVPAVAGASATTLNINSLGAKTCYTTNTSALTTHYSVGTPILLTYRDNAWRRADYNSNTTYSAMSVSEGTTGTATTSRTMRADYLKQIIAGLPSASCTGASASCTGNAASSTYTSNIRVAKSSASAWYPLPFITGSTANTNYAPKYHPGLNVDCYDGTTSANGYCFLQLGTATAYGTAGNAYGGIYLYKVATSTYKTPKRVIIKPPNVAAATDSDVTVTLPNATGTLALTSSNITGNSANVTGTVAIAHGGTGATTRLNALKALTNEDVGANATYFLTITNSWGKGGYSSVANVKSVLGIPASGTIATTASNITGSSASCTGNAASATYATNARITPTDHGTNQYPIVLSSGNAASTDYALRTAVNNSTMANAGLRCIPGADVAANTEGTTTLIIGNGLAKASADNRTGNIRIHGNNTGYTTIKPGYNSTSNINITLPSSAGTLALTSQISAVSVSSDANGTGASVGTLIINSFTFAPKTAGTTITFKKPFTNTNYLIIYDMTGMDTTITKTTTTVTLKGTMNYDDSWKKSFLAIGI